MGSAVSLGLNLYEIDRLGATEAPSRRWLCLRVIRIAISPVSAAPPPAGGVSPTALVRWRLQGSLRPS
ncbi:hypothetical protein M404DRAFT_998443 [Pisolithus tinctorius Marx 270]|uniref:Uncharacterized protein n=1 Tax=Pisolithus tinctorius Marx 270 TaxID=870435 RepID=A0A0C3JD58_PISTI|nr:hypothetical protein M404DRAFT_998443 [Pisolithus tinctorius Marx 270]